MMAKISKNIVALASVVLCAIFLAGHSVGPVAKAQTKQAEQIEDPYKHLRILVEAFVVEVKLSALYELGVSPIGQIPNSVSVENILKCLRDKGNAEVTAGAKLAVNHNRRGQMGSTETRYVQREEVIQSKRGDKAPLSMKSFESYDIGTQFEAEASITSDGKISVYFEFIQSTVDIFVIKDGPPTVVTRQWESAVCLEAGKPSVVGATQNEEMAAFLIICADIKSQ